MALNVTPGSGASMKTTLDGSDHVVHHRVDVSALPAGASTSAEQTAQTALLTAIDADTSAIVTAVQLLDNAIAGSEMQVDIVSSALPTGAATAANQSTIIGHVDGIEGLLTTIDADTGASAAVLGTTADAAATDEASTATVTAVLKALLREMRSTVPTSVREDSLEYETVAASQTTQTIGATGATGDFLGTLVCVVSTAATSQVQIKDGANGAITVLPNNVGGGVGTYPIPIGLVSVAGAWQVTTAAGVAVIATGNFT